MKDSCVLDFLSASFEKCRLKVHRVALPYIIDTTGNNEHERLISGGIPDAIMRETPDARTLYKHRDAYGLKYRYFKFSEDLAIVVGPYLSERVTESGLFEIGERGGITPKQQRYLKELYGAIPVLDENCALFSILDVFLERLWQSPSFHIVDREESAPPPSPINDGGSEDGHEDVLVSMRAMEQRYAYENELIEAVSLGQLHKEGQLLSAFSAEAFEKRLSDKSRNAKNYAIIMNTLLRKAAERGGVHPVYLDRISSEFAYRIELLREDESASLMTDMFRSYCRLVRKHSMRSYSPLVQKTVLIIDSDLASDLTLSSLAGVQGVSPGYLATVFKRETGKTISAYVRERRIKHAAHLLRTTGLQIQTVALHCGILDLQYFSKLFKRETGKTPKEYRESEKR